MPRKKDTLEWKTDAQLVDTTWWLDWTSWIADRGGKKVPAPQRPGNDDYPPIDKAPGTYVRSGDAA